MNHRAALEVMAGWGLDLIPQYARLLAAVDAKEWARIREAKESVRTGSIR